MSSKRNLQSIQPTEKSIPEWLSQICTVTDSSQGDLSKLTVSFDTNAIYNSILSYAFLCQLPKDHYLSPPTVDRDIPLSILADDAFEPRGLDPLDAKKDESDDEDQAKGSQVLEDEDLAAKSYPKFKFGDGISAVVWPPPACLDGINLAKRRNEYENDFYDTRLTGVKTAANQNDKDEIIDDTNPYRIDLKQVSSQIHATKQNTIYVMHYIRGEPVSSFSDPKLYKEVQLVTAAESGSRFLRKFIIDVLEWNSQKDIRDANGRGYTLHRFKTDNCGDGWWENEGLQHARPPSSVILPDGKIEDIMLDVERFLDKNARRWYITHGLPHRRSYLFHGPPGTGKTSTIRSIASKFNLNCCFLSMTNSNFSNQLLANALTKMPSNAILVLEDVDALFNLKRKSEGNNNLTFSGLLNALDGVISVDRSITVMTTNFINRLDKALIRGGRVDRKFFFDVPTDKELVKLFYNFYPDTDDILANKFVQEVNQHGGKKGHVISSLQQLFIANRDETALVCIESVKEFFEELFEHEDVEADQIDFITCNEENDSELQEDNEEEDKL